VFEIGTVQIVESPSSMETELGGGLKFVSDLKKKQKKNKKTNKFLLFRKRRGR